MGAGQTVTDQVAPQAPNPHAWRNTILAGLANYIDAGSIVAGSAALVMWAAAYNLSPTFLGLIGAFSANAGIEYRPEYQVAGEHSHRVARDLALSLLNLPQRPTAIFAASDTQALGVLEAAQLLSLRVPEQLSVIGYDDIEVAEYLGLTTIRQQLFESGKRGVALLMDAIAGRIGEAACEELPVTLIERRTTAPPASS